jgi:hypothetical protein
MIDLYSGKAAVGMILRSGKQPIDARNPSRGESGYALD